MEGEPAAHKDRMLLATNPHLVLDGAGVLTNAPTGTIRAALGVAGGTAVGDLGTDPAGNATIPLLPTQACVDPEPPECLGSGFDPVSGLFKSAIYVCPPLLADAPPFKLCSACKKVSYCNADCQKGHWKRAHKRECATLAGTAK
jgi:hypothetical protein